MIISRKMMFFVMSVGTFRKHVTHVSTHPKWIAIAFKGVPMNTIVSHDTDLIARIIERDDMALSELYTEYAAQVHGISLYILKNAALAEEATQDTFLKIWDNAHRWDGKRSNLTTWICTIARFTAIDIVRREHRHFSHSEVDESIGFSVDQLSAVSSEWDNAQHLNSLLRQLPQEQTQAIELAFFRGMSHQEIADHLCEPLGTIKSRIRNGLQVLRGMWLMTTS
jgi:RNA polymerase sigma-70 factor, ECF subfamily